MSTFSTGIKGAAAAFAAIVLSVGTAGAEPWGEIINVDFSNVAFAQTVGATSIPIGHVDFCRRHLDECLPHHDVAPAAALTPARWQQLVRVNNRINTEIVPVTDIELYGVGEFWAYPDGYGDCEDIALAKRRELIELGWHPSTLLMSVVRQQNGEGHAVLLVRTDRGDLILDNLYGEINVWSDTPYIFVKRQSQAHAGEWVQIDDMRPVVTVASTK